MGQSKCRSCGTTLEHTFVDLGMSPLANSYVKPEQLNCMEPFYPLHVLRMREMSACTVGAVFQSCGHFFRLRLFLFLFRFMACSCQGVCRYDHSAVQSRQEL